MTYRVVKVVFVWLVVREYLNREQADADRHHDLRRVRLGTCVSGLSVKTKKMAE